jgi:4-carboxymuconolactone decarboxylase
MSADRLPPIPAAQLTPEQAREAQAIIDGPRGALISPFIPLIRSPELMGHAQRMGEYLRYRSALPLRLSELAILVTARFWTQQVEWAIHVPIAQREGIAIELIDSIAQRAPPKFAKDDEALVYTFCNELHETQQVSDATWQRAIEQFGEQATMDLIGLCGYYAMLSMVMNAARTPVPASHAQPLPS